MKKHYYNDFIDKWDDYFYIHPRSIKLGTQGTVFDVGYELHQVKAGKYEEDAYTSHSFTIDHWVIKDRPDLGEISPFYLVKLDKLQEKLVEINNRVIQDRKALRTIIQNIKNEFENITGEDL